MAKRVAVIGATGYAGSELVALLARHSGTELVALCSSGGSGRRVAFERVHPSLARMAGPEVEPFDFDAVVATSPDCVFLATPNETSAELAPKFLEKGIRVVDLSGAFRLHSAGSYPEWYGFDHPNPELLRSAVYGLTEFCNGELKKAELVANPGCYPTAILLALRPLVHFLDRSQPIIADAKSGVSGAGKKAELDYSFAELSGNFKAYGVGHHRHTPEIRQGLPIPDSMPLIFVPHLLPTTRGILATLHLAFSRPRTLGELAEAYEEAYAGKPFVSVRKAGELPELKDVVGTPYAEIGFTLIDGGRRAVVVSVIDNLLKGAASQAVQNYNRMYAIPEGEGLS